MLKEATKKVVVKQLVKKQNGRFLSSMEDVWKELNKGHYVIGFDVRFSVENGTPKADFSLENVFHIQNNSFQSFVFTAGRRIPPHKIYFHQSFTGNTNLIKPLMNDWLKNNFDCFMVCDQLLDLKNSKINTKGN